MSSRDAEVLLIAEDVAHERFLLWWLKRLSEEQGLSLVLDSRTGSREKRLHELVRTSVAERRAGRAGYDLMVVGQDANCRGRVAKAKELDDLIQPDTFPARVAYAIPDPHVEKWYMADQHAFKVCFGGSFQRIKDKCERLRYKRQLLDALRACGRITLLGGADIAEELVAEMDGDHIDDRDLKQFLKDARAALKALR